MSGRPLEFKQEIADEICARLADGESLRKICLDDHMPPRRTVFGWLLNPKLEEFKHQYTYAREIQAESFADEMNDIADDASNDYMETVDNETGAIIGYKLNGEHINRSRLRIDTRKWIASKLKPKKYGEKVEVEHSGGVNLKHSLTDMTDEELAAIATGSSTGTTSKA